MRVTLSVHVLRQIPCSASFGSMSTCAEEAAYTAVSPIPTMVGSSPFRLARAHRLHELDDDWMLTHEMIHLAFPSMARTHHWIEEGISVYVEPIARVQAGQLSAERMWSEVVRDMATGRARVGDDRA